MTARSALIATARTLAGTVTLLAIFGLAATWLAATPAPPPANPAVDQGPTTRALDALRNAWTHELDELTASVRAAALESDTVGFVARPNIPYALEHFRPQWLKSERIDTVLIVDAKGTPLFWRRADVRRNHGFPDAKAFLKRLPPLRASADSGEPALAGAVRLARGSSLLVAMPIAASAGRAPSGWLIAARALDATQWQRYGEHARIDAEAVDASPDEWPSEAPAGGDMPATVVRVEPGRIRGWLAVYDLKGAPLKLFEVSSARTVLPAVAAAPSTVGRNLRGFGATAVIGALATLLLMFVPRRRNDEAAVVAVAKLNARAPSPQPPLARPPTASREARRPPPATTAPRAAAKTADDGDVEVTIDPDDGATSQPGERLKAGTAAAPAKKSAAKKSGGPLARMRERLTAAGCSFRYQPQVNLQRDRVVGVEALLCSVNGAGERPATEFIEAVHAEGLGLALAECWLLESCGERQRWLREVGGAFPVSVPVTAAMLEDPNFMPMLIRVIGHTELAPWLLELEISEAVFGSSPAITRALAEAHRVGVLLCIDGFGKAASSLNALAVVPVAKLRIDAALIAASAHDEGAAALVLAITGAARGLGIAVCATGVDSAREASTLEAHGRLLVQGVALGAPMDSAQFLELLRGRGVEQALPAETPAARQYRGREGAQG